MSSGGEPILAMLGVVIFISLIILSCAILNINSNIKDIKKMLEFHLNEKRTNSNEFVKSEQNLCPKCNKEVKKDIGFCPYCGANLKDND